MTEEQTNEQPQEAAVEETKAEEVKEEKAEEPKKEEAKAETPKAEEPKKEEAKAETPKAKEAKADLSPEAKKIVDTLKSMNVLDLSKLVKELESVFGVSAAAPVAAAGVAAVGEVAEEKTSFDVVLSSSGDKKIQVIKEVRTITGLGLKEAKDLVDAAPKAIKEGVKKEDADKIKAQLEGAGAVVEVK